MAKFSNKQEFYENSQEGSGADARDADNIKHYNRVFLKHKDQDCYGGDKNRDADPGDDQNPSPNSSSREGKKIRSSWSD